MVAGAGELPEGSLDESDVVRRGDVSAPAIQEKAEICHGTDVGETNGLGVSPVRLLFPTSTPFMTSVRF